MRTSITGTAGLVLTLLCSTLAAAPASAAPASAPLPVAPSEATPALRTLLTDVTGDGRFDRVELTSAGTDRYRLAVTVAGSGKTSAVEFRSALPADVDADAALYGAAAIDGTKGMELIVQHWDRSAMDPYASLRLSVYTWRGGKLTSERAPKGGWSSSWRFGDPWSKGQGYHFFDKGGRRYVDVSALTYKSKGPEVWRGKITRSLWRKGHWVKVSTRTVKLNYVNARQYLRYSGPNLLQRIMNADFDGDSRPDELRLYTYQDNGDQRWYRVKVTTATGKVSTKAFVTIDLDPLLGVTDFDGAAGAEILAQLTVDYNELMLLTWRNDKLVVEGRPTASARASRTWPLNGDDNFIQISRSVVEGAIYVDYLDTWFGWSPGDVARVDHMVWQTDKWVILSSTSNPISQEQFDALCQGLCGFTITKP